MKYKWKRWECKGRTAILGPQDYELEERREVCSGIGSVDVHCYTQLGKVEGPAVEIMFHLVLPSIVIRVWAQSCNSTFLNL